MRGLHELNLPVRPLQVGQHSSLTSLLIVVAVLAMHCNVLRCPSDYWRSVTRSGFLLSAFAQRQQVQSGCQRLDYVVVCIRQPACALAAAIAATEA